MALELVKAGRRGPRKELARMLLIGGSAALVLAAVVLRAARTETSHTSNGGLDASLTHADSSADDAVRAFTAFVIAPRQQDSALPDPVYMAEALRRLAAAVKLVIDREDAGDTSGAPAEIRIEADLLEREPLAAHRAEIVRAAFSSAADAAMSLQRRRYPHLQAAVEGLRSAARTIRVDQPLETQQAALQDFLDRASDVLRGMTESR